MDTTRPASVDTLARTLWGEARGCGTIGMSHVCNVVINRANNPRWWGDNVIQVCMAASQFSCWNVGDPNYKKLLTVDETDPEFRAAVGLAMMAVNRKLPDATGGADSYYALSMKSPPSWEKRAAETMDDGFHQFLRVELPAPDGGPDAPTVSVHTPTADELDDEFNPEVPK